MTDFSLSWIDTTIIVVYFLGIIWKGISIGQKHRTVDDYFLAGRSMIWPLVGISLFASNISSTTLIGLSGDAYSTGISVFNYEWMASIVLVFFIFFFLPQLLSSNVYTLPEFLEKRYDRKARNYFSVLTLFLNIVVDTAGSLFAGALLLKLVFPALNITEIVVGLTIASGLYTMAGGLKAVMYTDLLQTILLLIGAVFIAGATLIKVGGWSTLVNGVDPEMLSLIRPHGAPGVPWTGLVTGVPLLGFYFWCTNQFMAQRFLSAKNLEHARRGALFAGLLKLPVLFLMVLPGTAAIILFPGLERADQVYPTLMFELLPTGLLGLVLAGFLAALMSQIDSTLNSASTLVTMDFIRNRKPEWGPETLLKTGRIVTLIFMALSAAWAPQIDRFGSLFQYLQAVLSYAVPPVMAMYLLGLFWKRANARGALWSLSGGLAGGVALFLSNVVFKSTDLHFLYVGPILLILSLVLHVAGSLSAPAPDFEKVGPLMWTPRNPWKEETGKAWYADFRYQSVGLLVLTAAIVIWFW